MVGKIICLSGFKGSGKDWHAKTMFRACKRVAFADALKEDVSKIHKIPINYFHDVDLKDKFCEALLMTPRQALIDHATKMRKLDIHYFVHKIVEEIDKDDNQDYVITDLRFFSKSFLLSRRYGRRVSFVWIKRDGYEKGDDSIEFIEKDCDYTIDNIE